jgi:hypothetical protein
MDSLLLRKIMLLLDVLYVRILGKRRSSRSINRVTDFARSRISAMCQLRSFGDSILSVNFSGSDPAGPKLKY